MPREINPQVKYGLPWQDSVNAITNMGLNIGSLQAKEKVAQGDTRRAITRMITVAKKTRDEAIEKHRKKFPIKEGRKPSCLKKVGQQLVNEAKDTKNKESLIDKILDRLALFGFYPTKEWPTPEDRAQMDASS